MAVLLGTCVFLAQVSARLVVSYRGSQCGSPPVYPDKLLEERYAGKQEFNTGDKVVYKCPLGYTSSEDRVSFCQGGEWSPVEMQCTRKKCGSAGEILNGQFRQTGNAFGDKAYAECNRGYVLQGEPVRECLVKGWSGAVPTCVVANIASPASNRTVTCTPPKDNNATFHKTKATYVPGDTLSYSCNVGFYLTGRCNVLKCDRTGNWKPRHAHCTSIKCERFTIPNSRRVFFGNRTFNTKISISCKNGYRLRGPSSVTCGAHAFWTPALPICEPVRNLRVTCPPPAVPNSRGQNGYKEYDVGEHTIISCQEDFELMGSSQVTCGSDGKWQKLPECRLAGGKCLAPPRFPNAHTEHVNQGHYMPDTTVRFKCNHGYHMVRGPSTIHCRNGRWTDLAMICEKKKCGSAGEIANGRYHYTGAMFGDTAEASCNEGYRLVGASMRNCRATGWDGRAPVCEAIECPEPPQVPGAKSFYTNDIFIYGYVVSYQCHFGTIIGDSDIVCTENGTWNPAAPRCQVTCPIPDVRYGVILSGRQSHYPPKSSVTFTCSPGRRLSGPKVITCETDGSWKPSLPQCVL